MNVDSTLGVLSAMAVLSVVASWVANCLMRTNRNGIAARALMYDAATKLADAPRDRVPAVVALMAAALVEQSRGWFHVTRSMLFSLLVRAPERAQRAAEINAAVEKMEPQLQDLYHRVLAGFILAACARDPIMGAFTMWLLRKAGTYAARQAPPEVEQKIVMTFGPTNCHA